MVLYCWKNSSFSGIFGDDKGSVWGVVGEGSVKVFSNKGGSVGKGYIRINLLREGSVQGGFVFVTYISFDSLALD